MRCLLYWVCPSFLALILVCCLLSIPYSLTHVNIQAIEQGLHDDGTPHMTLKAPWSKIGYPQLG